MYSPIAERRAAAQRKISQIYLVLPVAIEEGNSPLQLPAVWLRVLERFPVPESTLTFFTPIACKPVAKTLQPHPHIVYMLVIIFSAVVGGPGWPLQLR